MAQLDSTDESEVEELLSDLVMQVLNETIDSVLDRSSIVDVEMLDESVDEVVASYMDRLDFTVTLLPA